MAKNYVFLLFLLPFIHCRVSQTPTSQASTSTHTKMDPLAAESTQTGLVSGLHTVTIATRDLYQYRDFYVNGWGMTLEGPMELTSSALATQRKLWELPPDMGFETYLLHRPEVPELIQIRLLVPDRATPHIHQSYSSRELGPFSLGFPNADQEGIDRKLRAQGVHSMAPLQEGTVNRGDGSSYRYLETIYQAPDFLHVVGIERKDGMPQLAPVDPKTKRGGPGYSAMVLDDSDAFIQFLTEVLDFELRADRTWKTSSGSALGLEAGIPFRFALLYAKGENHNHLLILDYHEGTDIPLQVAPRLPNRGLGMWTFRTTAIEDIQQRAEAFGSQILHGPVRYVDPILGERTVMTLLAPNDFLIEVFQP